MNDLARFTAAQDGVWPAVMAELSAGRKLSHWMWFVFPQLAGLGTSAAARFYAIATLEEARAFLAHPVLGPRLRAATERVLAIKGRSAREIFGTPDDLKFRSSMTLFVRAAPGESLFAAALEKYFGGAEDTLTLERLS